MLKTVSEVNTELKKINEKEDKSPTKDMQLLLGLIC